MQENTNKIIMYNTVILYIRLLLTSVISLFTTRFALHALGVEDFGLFSVLGSITTFIGIFNTIMVSTSNRYIAVSIGKGDILEANKQFNVNLLIHIGIAIITFLIAYPVGKWYIENYINFSGDISIAKIVFYISITGSIISFVGVPYNGLLMAKEKFLVFCTIDVLSHIFKLIVARFLLYIPGNKLVVYSITLSIISIYPTIIYFLYCLRNYYSIVKWNLVKDKLKYFDVFSFSGWVSYGAIVTIAKSQGAALLVNAFFSTVMNTALGIANSINALILMFAQNVSNPIAPQITKAYAAGNYDRCYRLLVLSTKLSFMVMLFISTPFIVKADWIISLWLGEVPPYSSIFTVLLVIDALITSLSSGISNIIFASGKIALYQLVVNTLRLLAIVAAYFMLKQGHAVYSLLYCYIIFSVINFIVIQWILSRTLKFDILSLFRASYYPSFKVSILFVLFIIIKIELPNILYICLSLCYVLFLILVIGLNKEEKSYCLNIFKSIIKRFT